jgi:hypothetical protein
MMGVGYLWQNYFSEINYDHQLITLSAAASAVAFLLPALFITSRCARYGAPSPRNFERVLKLLLLAGAATVAVGPLAISH